MIWKTLASALAVSLVLPSAQAVTHYGCWSDASNHFHEDCVVAYTSLVAQLSYTDHGDWVGVPTWLVRSYYGSCYAEIKSNAGYTLSATTLLDSFDSLGSRCQHGWFYYDNGWIDANIAGHAGWKRDEPSNTTASDPNSNPDLPHGGILEWETPDSPEQIPLPADVESCLNATTTETKRDIERQHARDLAARDKPFGTFIKSTTVGTLAYALYRGTGFIQLGQNPVNYAISFAFPATISAMVNSASTNRGSSIIRTGLAQPDGSTVQAIAIAAQLSGGYSSWYSLFQSIGGEASFMIGLSMANALQDMYNNGWTGAVYHIYNPAGIVIVTFILNGVTGTVSALPSS